MSSAETDYLQELSLRHDEVMEKLDELEERIAAVLDEYLGKVESTAQELQEDWERVEESCLKS